MRKEHGYLLPIPLLFPELLTRSMWNTVSPEEQISARGIERGI